MNAEEVREMLIAFYDWHVLPFNGKLALADGLRLFPEI